MSFDNSYNFSYTGETQYWTTPLGLASVYFAIKGAGGAGNSFSSSGGGGAYVFSNYIYLNPNYTYPVQVNVGSGGKPPPLQTGGLSIGGQDVSGVSYSNGGDGTTLNDLQSGGGGGMSSVFYMDVYGNQVIKLVAGGGGGAGNNNDMVGGDSGRIGSTGGGLGGGEGGNTDGNGNAGVGGVNGGANGYNFVDSSYNGSYSFIGGAGGSGGTFAGGGGGSGYGGGAGGKQGGGGGGGSYASPTARNSFITGGGGKGGGINQAGANGSVLIFWNVQIVTPDPIVSMYMLNSQHTCKSSYVAPNQAPVAANVITYKTPSLSFSNSGVIAITNNLYIISDDSILYAFNSDLSFRWSFPSPSNTLFIGTPVIKGDGTMYIGAKATTPTGNNYLYAIIDSGSAAAQNGGAVFKWGNPYLLDGAPSMSPVMDLSGIIYIGTDNGSIYAISDGYSQGALLWKYPVTPYGYPIVGTPAFDLSYNRLCYSTYNQTAQSSTIYAIDLSLNNNALPTPYWSQTAPTPNEIYGTPSIDNKGIVYVNTSLGNVYAYDTSNNGNPLWSPISVNDENLSSIAIGSDNKQIYFTSKNALNVIDSSNGILDWKYPIVPTATTSVVNNSIPVIDANNMVYFGGRDKILHSLNPLTRNYNWKYTTGGEVLSMPIISNTTSLYFGANDGKIYDISGNGPAIPTAAPIVPMYMLNQQHTGISAYGGPRSTPTIKWSTNFVAGNLFVLPSISIDSAGTLYIGSNTGFVYAFSSTTGASITGWPVKVTSNPNSALLNSQNSMYTTPAIAPDGTIYIGSNEGYLYALTPAGRVKWSYYAGYPLQSSPTLDAGGSIYFGAGCSVFALGDAGYRAYPKWLAPFATDSLVNSSPALGQNGYLYFGSCDGYLYAVDSFTGLYKWSFNMSLPDPVTHPIYTSPTVDSYNNVIIGNGSSMDGSLNYIDGATGTPIWQISYEPQNGPFYNTVAVNGDVIYLSTIAYVFAIDRPTGNVKWKFQKVNFYYTSPIVDASGTIYFASINARTSHGTVHSVIDNGMTYIENWRMDTGVAERLAPPVLGSDGTLYLSSTGNKIYALR